MIERIADFLRKCGAVLDAGSGSGYLSRELGRLGVKTFAVDGRDYREPRTAGTGYPIKAVHQLDVVGDATGFVASRFGAVLMVWPPLERANSRWTLPRQCCRVRCWSTRVKWRAAATPICVLRVRDRHPHVEAPGRGDFAPGCGACGDGHTA